MHRSASQQHVTMARLFYRLLLTVVILLLLVAAGAASINIVQQLLPVNRDLKNFSIMKDSLVYGKGKDLTKIYNGGYELYTKNGVIDAARQMYSYKDDYVEVTIHTMTSKKAATDFLKYWQKENKVTKLTKTKMSTSFLVTKPNVMIYSVSGKYFTTISAFYTPSRAKADTKMFMSVIDKKIGSQTK